VLTVDVYARRKDRPDDLAARWLAALREHRPDAVPDVCGDVEPLRTRLDGDDPSATLAEALDRADGLLFTRGGCRGARVEGHLSARQPAWWGPVEAHGLRLPRPTTPDDDVPRLLPALAVAAGASVAVGEVREDDAPRPTPHLAALGRWRGLPVVAPRWTWFGRAYAAPARRWFIDAPEVAGGVLVHDPPSWVPAAWQVPPDPTGVSPQARRVPWGWRDVWWLRTGPRRTRPGRDPVTPSG